MPAPEALAAAYSPDYYGGTRRKFVPWIANAIGWFQRGRSRAVAAVVPPAARILDVGCGNGEFLRHLQAAGFRPEGTEWTPESAARIPAEWQIPIHVGELTALALPSASYDAATLWHVFEHLSEPAAAIAELHRLLRPGAPLFLSMPNAESWQARLFRHHWFHLDPPRHLHAFGPRSLRRLLESRGFQWVTCSTFSLEQNPYGWMQSTLNAAGFPRERAYDTLKGLHPGTGATRALDRTLLALLAVPALGLSAAESLFGAGGTFTVVARRRA